MSPSHRVPPEDVSDVRPYILTGGRVHTDGDDVRFDTLVQASQTSEPPQPLRGLGAEQRAILAGLSGSYLTVADIAAQLGLPLGVAQVLVTDLVRLGALQVHDASVPALERASSSLSHEERYLVLDVLESVFDGISSL